MDYLYILVIVIALIAAFLIFAYDQNKRIVKTHYEIKSKDAQAPFKIVHISDVHSTKFKKLTEKVASEHPDLIALTGDLINDKGKNKEEMYDYVRKLTQIAPVYYVTGNHERRLKEFDETMSEIEKCGAHVLLDRYEKININGGEIIILGLDEKQGTFDAYKEMAKGTFKYRDSSSYFDAIKNLSGFKLVLTHFPENFALIGNLSYNQFDYDLMLAGHAHGGQFRLPFVGPVFSPGQGLFPKYANGKYGTRPALIVSRGMGNSEFPLRLFNHPEIIIIDVKPE